MDYNKQAIIAHKKWKGKIGVALRCPLETKDDLSTAYTPGVAAPCLEIAKDKSLSYEYTARGNTVAVISDGTAVLGLGNIGAEAAMPVMEGKSTLFKRFGDIDAIPIVLDTQDTNEIIAAVKAIAPSFGGINLEDISAPRCFEIERTLDAMLDIPVFHDDQHGTAIVSLAALINTLKLTGKDKRDITVVMSGAGAAGTAITHLFNAFGVGNVIVTNSKGIISRKDGITGNVKELAECTNKNNITGGVGDALKGADFFFGVSAPNIVTKDMIRAMKPKAAVFAMANPVPEIFPKDAKEAGAYVVGSGRSDFENQVNNVLAFPGVFKGALKARARSITFDMKIAAANALADCVKNLSPSCVIPNAFDEGVADAVADAVFAASKKEFN